MAGGLAAGWGVGADRQRLIRAAVGHALRFGTWRSLSSEDLSDHEAVELMVGFVSRLAEGSREEPLAESAGFGRDSLG